MKEIVYTKRLFAIDFGVIRFLLDKKQENITLLYEKQEGLPAICCLNFFLAPWYSRPGSELPKQNQSLLYQLPCTAAESFGWQVGSIDESLLNSHTTSQGHGNLENKAATRLAIREQKGEL